MVPSLVSKSSVVIDCRWIGYSGVGRITELLLAGLNELSPPGAWTLWGPLSVEAYAWPSAKVVAHDASPTHWAAQRDVLSVPKADITMWMHAARPLVPSRSLVLLHDLIPLHFGSAVRRRAWRLFLSRSCRQATIVAVNSDATARALANELGVQSPTKVSYPLDRDRANRIRSLRSRRGGRSRLMLYVGQVKPHKNLRRAVDGYLASRFCADGGAFSILAGGAVDPSEMALLRSTIAATRGGRMEILSHCTEDELDQLYGSAAMLIQPSLEEGYGLPVVEALAGGIPVCCSDIGPLREAAHGEARLFDPLSTSSIASAIDEVASMAAAGFVPDIPLMPTRMQFAQEFVEMIERAARSGQAASASA